MTVLTDKIAVVTGAGSGIGEAIATLLHEEGAKVVLAGRNKDKLQNVANQLAQDSVKVVPTDVTNKEEVDELIKIAQQTFGGLDIVINSAGQMLSSKITDYQVDEWDSMIDVNIKGTLYTAQAALPTMLEQSSGHLINIASISGFEVTKSSTIYSATKAAVHTITQGLEKELAKTGVKVTSISPGMVDTAITAAYNPSDRKKLDPQDIAEAVLYALTQPKHVNVNEITVRPV
ncbi:short-chain dehydrogenase/reductase family oxidoreductase [Staphylococcus aureus F36683]|uniref:SDR family oxidoreductase n=1 Tax=Staphylococcus aureus TaxID=1280 RepID=UPI00045108FE|nr:SDR family oxidoreductase [Staphylococcus aureus]EWJ98777.1 short-chain dehydrogenase/reductase family oxidoreductase [Staphylococcus aureus F36683]EWL93937.1 short-chain dehydrogenase/reductase family oxidoreductase [Staphylococcus aureus F16470]EWV71255.1 short-chain dehydrogenase/reductase family oxidoreductase [Staphylococcus aureus T74091]EYK50057.1 short-chain dehydrogenase/reductase family oxidoreductase [Staphylococcus aureus T45836]MBR8896230.1 SDR family oxidoreductase [Staphyloco